MQCTTLPYGSWFALPAGGARWCLLGIRPALPLLPVRGEVDHRGDSRARGPQFAVDPVKCAVLDRVREEVGEQGFQRGTLLLGLRPQDGGISLDGGVEVEEVVPLRRAPEQCPHGLQANP